MATGFLLSSQDAKIYMPGILKDAIDLNVPDVEATVRIANSNSTPVFQVNDNEPISSDLLFADEDFFKLFTFKAVEGNLISALKEPMSVVITKSLSNKLFGKENALGKTIKYDNKQELTIRAVLDENRMNSCLSFNAITSNTTRKIIQPNSSEFTNWGIGNFQIFVLLDENVNPNEAINKIAAVTPKNYQKGYLNSRLIPLQTIHFSKLTLYGNNYLRFGNKRNISILGLVAALVLVIALINFINISSSQWQNRIRQTGVIKVIGAKKSNVIFHVLAESFLIFFIAYIFASLLATCCIPLIKSYTGINFNIGLLYSPKFFVFSTFSILGLSIILSLIPAIRISSSKAIDNLKKQIDSKSSSSIFRGTIVTLQFLIAIVLIAFTVLVQKQVNFGKSNMEINQNNIIGIKLTKPLIKKRDLLKTQLMEIPGIEQISFGNYFPGKTVSNGGTIIEQDGKDQFFNFDVINTDADFFKLMGLQLTMGRFFVDSLSSDDGNLVVNEAFVREQKLENPVGMSFKLGMDEHLSEIVGVVKDFHYKPVNQPISSLAIQNNYWSSHCLVNIQTGDFNGLQNTINRIKSITTQLSPAFPVEIAFLDQAVENMYQSELQFRRTFSLFAFCALVICCMGILAMSIFACQNRIKEIGIRKINGAKISDVMAMLNRDFVKWVAIAFLIATPMAWFAMHKWLENFAYKTELSWWIFALAGILALGIALLTVSWQSWRAATRNPVEALRYE